MKVFSLASVLLVAVVAGCSDSTASDGLQGPPSDLGSMHVGNVRVMTFSQAQAGLTIPASQSSAVYVIVAANVAGDTGTVPQYTIMGNMLTPDTTLARRAPAPPSRAALQMPVSHPMYTRAGGVRGAQFEATLRQYERSHLRPAAARALPRSPRLRANYVPVGTTPAAGSIYQFNVPTGDDPCNDYTTVTAKIMKVSDHAIIAMDTSAVASGFTTQTYDSVAAEFDTYIYPTEASYYGTPTDIDGNGRVYILYTPAVNRETPPGTAESQGYIGGYTFAGDFFPATGVNSCAESNQGEIFYLLAPDPTGKYGNRFSVSFVQQQTRVTMAHELQHAISDGVRIENPAAVGFESAWLDEALSSLAEDNVGRTELGYSDLQTLSLSTMQNMDTLMFGTFFAVNFERAQLYAQRPDTIGAVVTDERVEQDLAAFGAGWAFLRYTVDWFSGGNPRALTKALVAGPDTGTANLVQHAGAPLDTLLARWLITMYTDGQGIPNLPAQYNYKTYNLRDIVSALQPDTRYQESYPYLPVTPIGNGSNSIPIGIPSTSADYFITSQSSGGARTIRVTGSGGAAATDGNGRLYVIRIQ